MMQTYHGYVREGRFISRDGAEIPNGTEVLVVVTGKELPQGESRAQRQLEAVERFIAANRAITDEPLDEEFDAIINSRFSITRELDL
ncbi:MAG: hypothetical protein LBS19_12035 [Clostridiales bacterium]|jgi:hypothetical protein|nr:hypothetical protein [Clostridiales bacterium]